MIEKLGELVRYDKRELILLDQRQQMSKPSDILSPSVILFAQIALPYRHSDILDFMSSFIYS